MSHQFRKLVLANRSYQINVLPAQTRSLTMVVDNPGDWVHHCQVLNHLDMGMIAKYHVS